MPSGQSVVFRGSKEGLEIVLGEVRDFDTLKDKLREQLKRAESFFQVSDVVLNTGDTTLSLDEILEIQNILAYPYGLRLKKIIHGNRPTVVNKASRKEGALTSEPASVQPGEPQRASGVALGAVRKTLKAPAPKHPDTLLYRGTLRSGQRIDHDGNVVVLGDVNPGAEVRASGDIVVVGALRGLAHAGSGGSAGVVVAFKLEPTQLRIGDVIGRPPEGERPGGEPEVAKLKDGVILIEPLEGAKWEGER